MLLMTISAVPAIELSSTTPQALSQSENVGECINSQTVNSQVSGTWIQRELTLSRSLIAQSFIS
jgi:hypothetical protein